MERIKQLFYALKTDDWENHPLSVRITLGVLGATVVAGSTFLLYWYGNYRRLYKLPFYNPNTPPLGEVNNTALDVRVINFDGALLLQKDIIDKYNPLILDLTQHGPAVRLDCTFGQYKAFERELARLTKSWKDTPKNGRPLITFYGSNDFHHVSLALIRRIRTPINVVIFDNHPDYCQYYPLGLHCGCWFHHVASLPTVNKAFHLGGFSGEFEDDMVMRWSTPWKLMRAGKLVMLPAQDIFKGGKWAQVKQDTLRPHWSKFVTEERLLKLLEPYKQDFQNYPLYITLDKDVMKRQDSLQNWNSGVLVREEVLLIINVLIKLSNGRLYAMDVTGDFSKVDVAGLYRAYLHKTQHSDSENNIEQRQATFVNQMTNRKILSVVSKACGIEDWEQGEQVLLNLTNEEIKHDDT
eukprot:TRINITY_DN6776_c0_g1_i1.p1 TRINITY_DN6776_c0_g1~~TRINITY_DN6776_c0_g1_i1.p1  ORF type:complete len:409 (-),score=51.71 TRINITY_DN6776_c0_g1_i1:132-1358(-)